MTRIGNDFASGAEPRKEIAEVSPDGRKFAIVLRRGNLERNTNEYSLLVWRSDEIESSRPPTSVLTMSSSSNREGIRQVKWLADNETVVFLGEHPGELQQLYRLNTRTRVLQRISSHISNLISYSMTPDGTSFAFVAEEPVKSLWNQQTLRSGFLLGETQHIFGVLAGKTGGEFLGRKQLFWQSRGRRERRMVTNGIIDNTGSKVSVSPNGRYVLLSTRVSEIPEVWKEYADVWVHGQAVHAPGPGEASWLERFEWIDSRTGQSRFLIDSPLRGIPFARTRWAADGSSVVVSDVYLPLESTSGQERERKKTRPFAVEVKIPSGEVIEITDERLRIIGWDTRRNITTFENEEPDDRGSGSKVYFRKDGGVWRKTGPLSERRQSPEIFLEQDMNTPPRIVTISRVTHEKTVLFDLNPQFRQLKFGREEEIGWKLGDGTVVKGGLYYPVGYRPGVRYPLVIQTHAFRPDQFWIDGPWTTAFAAQPLAGKGIMVLQTDESYEDHNSVRETDREVARLETAIDYLDEKGLIDPKHVGIIGFSRTCLYVKYLLTHSSHPFAAASVADGMDAGYFQYLLMASQYDRTYANEGINGGPPWGSSLSAWLRRSPGFNIEKVQTPLRIFAEDPFTALGEWEWHAVLVRMGKPVEMVMMKDGDHILQKPWERMVSQQGNVDWFAFWLKGEEDPDPAKAEQYARWRKMRSQLEAARNSK